MIYKEVEYPWGKHWICYDSWTFKQMVITKEKDKLGNVLYKEEILEERTTSTQGEYASLEDIWVLKKDMYSKKYKVDEYNSNYYEVIIGNNVKWAFVKIGHLSMNTEVENKGPDIRCCLQFLNDDGWSELIDSRWKDDVTKLLKKHIPFVTDKTIEETLNIVIV